MPRTDVLRIKDLRALCEGVRAAVVADDLATPKELEAVTPGSPGNRDTTVRGWLLYLRALDRFHGRLALKAKQASDPQADELALMDLIRSEPERVELVNGGSLLVYPKGADALIEMAKWDHDAEWVATRADVLAQDPSAEAAALRARCLERLSYYQAVLCWIACEGNPTDGMAAIPYDDTERHAPTPPSSYRALDAFDVSRILRAYLRVNRDRLEHAYTLIPQTGKSTQGKKRARWSVFLANAANELGLDPNVLAKRWDLARAVAQAAMTASAKIEAQQAAEAEAAAKAGARGAPVGRR